MPERPSTPKRKFAARWTRDEKVSACYAFAAGTFNNSKVAVQSVATPRVPQELALEQRQIHAAMLREAALSTATPKESRTSMLYVFLLASNR